MASTTSSKKEIVDFLWEWADPKGDWARLLTDTIVKTESQLDTASRKLIFDHFLDSLRTTKQLPALNLIKPPYSPSGKTVFIKSLHSIAGVNRLAGNQRLEFCNNITVVYGENGSGKTGYGRILKSLGFSYEPNKAILSNIHATAQSQSAIIDFESNGISASFQWDGRGTHPELAKTSVFNNSCVQLSLIDRELIVSPIGFHLFELITLELNELSNILQQKILQHPIAVLWANLLHENTVQQSFILGLNRNSTELALSQVGTFTQIHAVELQEKEKELADLNPTLLETQQKVLILQADELNGVLGKIRIAESTLSFEAIKKLLELNKIIRTLKSKTQSSLKEVASANGIAFYEKQEFADFLQAAESYIRILEQPDYPQEGDSCVYCNQSLDGPARELLGYYKKLLNDTTQEDLRKAEKERNELLATFVTLVSNILLNHASFGYGPDEKILQPVELIAYNSGLKTQVEFLRSENIAIDFEVKMDFAAIINLLESNEVRLRSASEVKRQQLSQIVTSETTLKAAIGTLKDKRLLSDHEVEIKNIIKNHKVIAILKDHTNDFITTSISRKTSEAREGLMKQNFDTIFQREMNALKKGHIKIDLNFGTSRGHSKVTQKINTHSLMEILSEGEQKAIALAEFLTELQLDVMQAPVIFDDPVNSLDHRIADEVCKRLIELSKTRQVIVFTHSILLLNGFIQQSKLEHYKQAGVAFAFHSVKDNFGESGIVGDVDEINSHGYYKTKLEKVLKMPSAGQDEATLAAEGYGHLRSMVEVLVEEGVLQGTVKRYSKGVAFPALMRVKGDRLDQHKSGLNNIYEKCCVSIIGHSSPGQVHNSPKMDELKADYDSFIDIKKQFA